MGESVVAVLAILVATNGEAWLPDVIDGLLHQTYEHLEVIAVDNASTDASGDLLAKAFGGNAVVLDRRVGYGRALAAGLRVALERGNDADAFLIVHDDAALEPGAVQAMIAVLQSDDRVGIVGGKVLEWDDASVLQEMGMSTDRYGRLFSGLERGELDQGQHDGTRDTLFCTSTAMLVRRTLVEEIGLFDLRFVAMRDDLDLCMRAHLSGWRVVVTSDARTRHAAAAVRGVRHGPVATATRYFGERNLIATVLKNYSAPRLALLVPVLLVQSLGSSLLQLIRGRRGQTRQILGAIEWNFVHAPSTLRARARTRRRHVEGDAAVTRFMVRGAPRLRGYVERVLESVVGEPVEGIEETEIGSAPDAPTRRTLGAVIRDHPFAATVVVLAAIYLVGARSILGSGGLAGEILFPFPSRGDFFREFFSGWRSVGVAGAHPPAPALFVLGLLSILSFGSSWLASRILVLGLLPTAGLMAGRLAGRLGLGRSGRIVAGTAYALSPLALAAYGGGRLPELILLALAPGVLTMLLRSAGVPEPDPDVDAEPEAGAARWRALSATTAWLAVAASLSPWALPFTAGAAVVVALAAGIAGAPRPAASLRDGFVVAAGAAVLLLPWSTELIRSGTPLGLGGTDAPSGIAGLVRLAPGGSPLGVLAWAFPAAAVMGVVLAGRRRPRLVLALTVVALAALLVSWGAGRTDSIAPRQALPLTGVAVAIAVLAGVAVETISPALRRRSFGFTHAGVALVTAFLVAAVAIGIGWTARGHYDGLRRSGGLAPAFLEPDAIDLGAYRVLWIGGDRGGPGRAASVTIDLTDANGTTMLAYAVRRRSQAEAYASKAVASILAGRTDLGGRLLAPLGVREVIVRPDAPPSVGSVLERQSDLRFRESFGGAHVFDDTAWLPIGASVSSGWAAAAAGRDPFGVDVPVDAGAPARGLAQRGPATFDGTVAATATKLLLAEPYDDHWQMRAGSRVVRPSRSFGFLTSFAIPTRTVAVRVEWRGQRWTRVLLLVELGVWVLFGSWWSRRAALERGER